mmetsp:Transcript_27996/g.60986  ORF Transcript_27996/g.60986 Transcript_27996/m.60986 type:complete len:211 (-) Transcript_27996:780-1412(-)
MFPALANGSSYSSLSLFSSRSVTISAPLDEGLRNHSTALVAAASASSCNLSMVDVSSLFFAALLPIKTFASIALGPLGMGQSTAKNPGTNRAAILEGREGTDSRDGIRLPLSSRVAGCDGLYQGGDSPYLVYRTVGAAVAGFEEERRSWRARLARLPICLPMPRVFDGADIRMSPAAATPFSILSAVIWSYEYVSLTPYRARSTELSLPN